MLNPLRFIVGTLTLFAFMAVAFLCCLVGLVLEYLVFRPFFKDGRRRAHKFCNNMVNIYWVPMVYYFERWAGVELIFYGDEMPLRENGVLIISNHREMSDWLLMLSMGIRRGRLGVVKFFVKNAVKLVPGIGYVHPNLEKGFLKYFISEYFFSDFGSKRWGLSILQMVYLSRQWDKDQKKIERAFANIKHNKLPFWLVSFLEGTRFTQSKHQEGCEWAKSKGLKPLKNLLHPRVKGFQATVMALREELEAVYDVTFAGNAPTLFSILMGTSNTKVHVHVKRYTIDKVPNTPDGIDKWCRELWYAKDEMLEKFKKEGKFERRYELPLQVSYLDLDSVKKEKKTK